MKCYTILIGFIIYLMGILFFSHSEVIASPNPDSLQSAEEKQKKLSIGAFPIIFYSDETRLAGGAGVQVVYKKQSEQYSSSVWIMGFYTQNKQYRIDIAPEIYLREGAYRFSGDIDYSYFPDKFYGIGNNTSKDDEEDYTLQKFLIKPSFQKRVYSNLYIGLKYDFTNTKLTDIEEGKLLDSKTISGSEGGTASGLGIIVTWDSRDNNIYPTSGSYHQFLASSYGSALGSDFTFNKYLLDLRHYMPILSEHILAFQGVIGINTGNTPFQMLNQLGFFLRGYYQSRFEDKNVVAFQAEYRLPLFWKLGLVGFAGCGQVAHEFENISLKEFKPSAGVGIRFALIPEQKVNMRIDLGVGKDDSSFDINIMEAF